MQVYTARGRGVLAICWILATALGWSVGLLPSQIEGISSSFEFTRALLILSLNGLMVGAIMGFLQCLVLRHLIKMTRGWLLATLLGCLLTEALGLIIAVVIPLIFLSLHGMGLAIGELGWTFIPMPFYIIYSGFMIGLFQSFVLRRSILKLEGKAALLWVLGTWLGIGLGVFAGLWVEGILFSFPASNVVKMMVERMTTGTILGLTTLSMFFIIQTNPKIKRAIRSLPS